MKKLIDGDFRGRNLTRLIHSILPFSISFPLTVSTTHSITVYAPVVNLAAIIKQVTARGTEEQGPATADITLYTNLQYPFKLVEPQITYNNRPDLTDQTVSITTDCLDNANTPCEQLSLIHMKAPQSPPICDYNGDWTISYMAICENSLGNNACPLPINPSTGRSEQLVTVTYHLTSENFCPKVLATVQASVALQSYQDQAHTIVKNDFILNDRTYWVATVSSTDASIVEVSTNAVTVGGTTLYSTSPPPSVVNPYVNFAHTDFLRSTGAVSGVSDDPTHSFFEFNLDPRVFSVPVDSSQDFTVHTVLNVVFRNTDPTQSIVHSFSFNPLVMRGAETTPSEYQASHNIKLAQHALSDSSNSDNALNMNKNAFIGIIAGSVIAFILISAAVIYFVRRSRKSTTAKQSAQSAQSVPVPLEGVVAETTAQSHL